MKNKPQSYSEEQYLNIKASGSDAVSWYRKQLSTDMAATNFVDIPVFDPCRDQVLWSIPQCDVEIVDFYVNAAKYAQIDWVNVPASEKSQVLNRCADAIDTKLDLIAKVLALETGKALSTETTGEATLPSSIFRYFAGLTHEIKGQTIQMNPTLLGFTTYHPWGVVAGIVPWNVPLMFMAYKVASSIASGNAVVVKMPEQSSAALAIIYRLILPLLPDKLVSFISGTGQVAGKALVENPGIDKISFTGSVETGVEIKVNATRAHKSVTLEMGGKSPMIVLDDCDENTAINGIMQSMRFSRAGQSCTASSRVYVPKKKLATFRSALEKRLSKLIIGDPLDPSTECGPVVSRKQKESIISYIEKANNDGLDIFSAGMVADQAIFETGYFIKPHVIVEVDEDHLISTNEIFGPVVILNSYETVDDVIKAANRTDFGLSASVWGKNIQQCMQCASNFNSGIVQINQNAVMLPGFSYGGIKKSGDGIESSLEAMLSSYMFKKTTILNFNENSV